MNCTNANQMNIAGFLQSKGFRPHKVAGNSFWYCSPLRAEKTPSFKVDRVKNLWYDFGTATGGRLLDLVCKIYDVDLSGALLILSGQRIVKPVLSFSDKQPSWGSAEPKLEIIRLQPLQNYALIQYLSQRRINHRVASLHCKEAYYKTYAGGKEFFCVAFENDHHGWELRSKYFKGSTSPKDITTIRGKDSTRVKVYEGFMDYLSALSYYNIQRPTCDSIVLNGVGFVERFIALAPRYSHIDLYLDNDAAGREACRRIQILGPDAANHSPELYPDQSPLPKSKQEILNRAIAAAKILDKNPVRKNAVALLMALYPEISRATAFRDLSLAESLFPSIHTFDYDLWRTFLLNDIFETIQKCRKINTVAAHSVVTMEHINLLKVIGKRPEEKPDPNEDEPRQYFLMIPNFDSKVKVDIQALKDLPVTGLKELRKIARYHSIEANKRQKKQGRIF